MFGKLCDRSCSAKQPGGDRIATPTCADEMMSRQINHVGEEDDTEGGTSTDASRRTLPTRRRVEEP